MYYANASHIIERIQTIMLEHELRENMPLTRLIIDASGINFMDITAAETLSEFLEEMHAKRIPVGIIYLRFPVKRIIDAMPHFPRFSQYQNIADMRNVPRVEHLTPRARFI